MNHFWCEKKWIKNWITKFFEIIIVYALIQEFPKISWKNGRDGCLFCHKNFWNPCTYFFHHISLDFLKIFSAWISSFFKAKENCLWIPFSTNFLRCFPVSYCLEKSDWLSKNYYWKNSIVVLASAVTSWENCIIIQCWHSV